MILKNSVKCKLCGDVITSVHADDYEICECGATFVSGGHETIKYGSDKLINVEPLHVVADSFDDLACYETDTDIVYIYYNSKYSFPKSNQSLCSLLNKQYRYLEWLKNDETRSIKHIIEDFCRHSDKYTYYANYSGKGMYGKECVGIVCSSPMNMMMDLTRFIEKTDYTDQYLLLQNPCVDEMGLDYIVYFPYINSEK